MLEYGYVLLKKISFDNELFRKEIKKLIKYLTPDEVKQLNAWLQQNYNTTCLQN